MNFLLYIINFLNCFSKNKKENDSYLDYLTNINDYKYWELNTREQTLLSYPKVINKNLYIKNII